MYNENFESLAATADYQNGICELLFAPLSWLQKVPDFRLAQSLHNVSVANTWNIAGAYLEFGSGKSWLTLNSVALSAKFKETPKETASGTAFESSVEVTLNADLLDTENQQLLRSMVRNRFVVVVKQHNSAWRLLGNTKQGARFLYGYENTNTALKNECRFYWESVEPAPVVTTA